MEVKQAFGIVLKQLRKEKGVSQEHLALGCNFDRTYIGMLERGERQPTITTIFTIGRELNIKPSTIVKLIEQEILKKPSEE